MPAADRDPERTSGPRSRVRALTRDPSDPSGPIDPAQPDRGRPEELAVLRLQQQAGNAAVTGSLRPQQQPENPRQPQRRTGRIGPPPRQPTAKQPPAPADRSPHPAPSAQASPGVRSPTPESGGTPPPGQAPAPHSIDLDSAREGADRLPVPPGDGPTAAEGAAELAAARATLDDALVEVAVESGTPTTAAGATIVDAVTSGGQAARAGLATATSAAADAMLGAAGDVTGGLAETEASEVAAVAAADRQTVSAIGAAVDEAQGTVGREQQTQAGEVGAWSQAATRTADSGVAEESAKIRDAGREQSRQTVAAGVETGATTAGAMAGTAGQTGAGVGGGRGGDVAQAYDQVDQKISGDTAAQMRGAAVQAQVGMQTHAAQAASAVLSTSDQAAAAVGHEAPVLRERLAATSQHTRTVLADAAGQAGQHLAGQGTAAVRRLAGAAATGRQLIHSRSDEARGTVSAAAAGLIRRLAGRARGVMAASRRSQASAARRLRSVRLGPTAAATAAGAARTQLLNQSAGAAAQAAATVGSGTAALGGAQAELGTALHGLGADQRAELTEAGSRVGAGARRLAVAAGEALGRVTGQARAAGDALVETTRRGLAVAAGQAGAGLAQATAAVRAHLAERQSDVATRTADAAADTSRRVAAGQQRLDQSMSGGPPVQRGILGDIVDWVGDQLSDLFDLLSNPGFWVGLLVTVVLFPVMGPGAIVVGGAAGGLASGIHDNIKNGRPWYEPHTLIKHVAIGTFAGAAFALGGGVLVGLGLEGGALLGGVMALSGGIGIGVNLATGERWDKGLVANLFLGWLFHKVGGQGRGKAGEGEEPGGRGRGRDRGGEDESTDGTKRSGEDETNAGKAKPVPTGQPATQARAQALVDRIVRMQEHHEASGQPDPVLENRLQGDLNDAQALARRAERAATDEEVRAVDRDLKAAEKRAYDSSIALGRVQITRLVQALVRRITEARNRIPDRNRVSPDDQAQLARLRAELDRLDAERAAIEREAAAADSARKIEALADRAQKASTDLDAWDAAHRNLLRPAAAAELGLSPEAADALRIIAEQSYNPLGDYNRGGDGKVTNHYAAARKEAAGQRVGPADPNEPPFDHIRDLQGARDAVAGARDTLRTEAANPRPGITDRGIRLVLEKLELAGRLLRRVDEFLESIGWPASRPHKWVQENGQWVGQGDPVVIRPRLSARVNRARATAEGLDRTIARDVTPARQPALRAERQAILDEADAINARLEAAQNEAGLNAEEPAIRGLENRATTLRNDTYE